MNERSIFAEALERDDPRERAAFVDEACGGDGQLRNRVEALLQSYNDAGSFLERPPHDILPTIAAAHGDTVDEHLGEISLDFLAACDSPNRLGKLGQYEVIDVVGRGGMGVVLRAHDTKLNRVVAIKAMAPELAANPMAVKRFLREAEAAAAVMHDHVVSIHAIEDEVSPPYIVMEFVDGVSLQEKIDKSGALELREILRIAMQTAAGLAAAHKQGLVHRDIKPANILLENGVERVKITDFGLARAVDDVNITRTGMIAGTPQYMSPEQAQGEGFDHRSDLFALGSVMYAMCTGRPAFRADSALAVMRRVCDDDPRPIHEINADIPPWLEAIVERLLAKDPSERFQSAEEVAELLAKWLAHVQQPALIPPPEREGVGSLFPDTKPSKQRKPAKPVGKKTPDPVRSLVFKLTAAALALLLLIGGALGVIVYLATNNGTLVIESVDPDVQVVVKQADRQIQIVDTLGQGKFPVRLRVGDYDIEIQGNDQTLKLSDEQITIRRGEKVVVRITRQDDLSPPSPSEIEALLQNAVLALNFDKGSFYQHDGKTYVRDISGNRHDARLQDARYTDTGRAGGAVQIDGGDPLADKPIDEAAGLYLDDGLIPSGKPFTVAGWIWLDETPEGQRPFTQVFSNISEDNDAGVATALDRSHDFAMVLAFPKNGLKQGDPGHSAICGSPARTWDFAEGRWGFIAFSREPDGVLRLTCDGKTEQHNLKPGGNNIIPEASVIGRWLRGRMDELVVLDRALSADEVNKLYRWGLAGRPLPSPKLSQSSWTAPQRSEFSRHVPMFTPDGLTRVNHEFQGSPSGDIWMSRRDDLNLPWTEPANLGQPVSDPDAKELYPFLTDDGLTLYFQSERAGGRGGADLWVAKRASVDAAWGEPENLAVANDSSWETAPHVSSDGLTLLFATDRPGGEGRRDLWMCQRNALDEPWTEPVNLRVLNSEHVDEHPTLSRDGRMIVFASNRPGGEGELDLWMSQRPSPASPWSPPVNLGPVVNSPQDDKDPQFSFDGSLWYLSQDRGILFTRPMERESRDLIAESRRLPGHAEALTGVAWPTADRIVSCSHEAVGVWDVASGKLTTELKDRLPAEKKPIEKGRMIGPSTAFGFTCSSDGKLAATGHYHGIVCIWDLEAGKQLQRIGAHWGGDKDSSCAYGLAFTPDGKQLVTGGVDGWLRSWDVATGELTGEYEFGDKVRALAMHPDGQHVLAGSFRGKLDFVNWETKKPVRQISTVGIFSLAISPDGRLAVGGSSRGRPLYVWDLQTGEPLHELKGQSDTAESVAFTPDGRHVLCGTNDRKLRMWDVASGREVFTHTSDTHVTRNVAVSPDGEQLVTGGGKYWDYEKSGLATDGDYDLRLWRLKLDASLASSGESEIQEALRYSGHKNWIYQVLVTADGERVISCSNDRTIRIWQRGTGKLLQKLDAPWGVTAIALSKDESILASACGGHSGPEAKGSEVLVWDMATSELLKRFAAQPAETNSIALSPDGRQFLTGSFDGHVRLWDWKEGKVLRVMGDGAAVQMYDVAFLADNRAIWLQRLKAVQVWDMKSGEMLHSLADEGKPREIAIAADGKTLAVAMKEGRVQLFDLPTGERKSAFGIPLEHQALSIAFTPDGRHLITGGDDERLAMWEVATGQQVAQRKMTTYAFNEIAVTPDGRHVVSGGGRKWDNDNRQVQQDGDYALRLWRLPAIDEPDHTGDLDQVGRYDGHTDWISHITYASDGGRIVTSGYDETIRVWDAATGKLLKTINTHNAPLSIALSPDNRYVVAGMYQANVVMWDLQTGQIVRPFVGHEVPKEQGRPGRILSVAFSPDGNTLASCGDDATVRLWEVATGKQLRKLELVTDLPHGVPRPPVATVAFSPDGKTVLAADYAGLVSLWNTDDGKQIDAFPGHKHAAISPDGRWIAAGSKIYDAHTREQVRELPWEAGGNFVSHQFTRDSKFLVVGKADGSLWVYDVATGEDIAVVRCSGPVTNVIAVSPDGRHIATGGGAFWSSDQQRMIRDGDFALRVWRLPEEIAPTLKFTEVAKCEGHERSLFHLACAPDGKLIYSVDGDTLRQWDAASGELKRTFEVPEGSGWACAVAVSPDGKLVLTGHVQGKLTLWNAATGEVVRQWQPHKFRVDCVAFTPDGKYALSACATHWAEGDAGPVKVYRTADWEVAQEFHIGNGGDVYGFAVHPDSRHVLLSATGPLQLRNLETGELVRTLDDGTAMQRRGVAIDESGRWALTGSNNSLLVLWDLTSGKEARRFHGHGYNGPQIPAGGIIARVGFVPGTNWIVSSGWDRTLRLWDRETGVELARDTADSQSNQHVAVSPDGRHVVTGGGNAKVDDGYADDGDFALRIWRLPEDGLGKLKAPEEPASD